MPNDRLAEQSLDPQLWQSVADAIGPHPYTYDLDDSSHRLDVVQIVCEAIAKAGKVIIDNEPDHYVNFDEGGWFILHSVPCRIAGTIGTCEFNQAIRAIGDTDHAHFGIWRITNIDSEGLPSLERVDV